MNDNNSVRVLCSNSKYQSVASVPCSQIFPGESIFICNVTVMAKRVLPISLITVNSDIVLAGIRVNEDKRSRLEARGIGGPCEVEVIEEPRNTCVVRASAPLDRLERLSVQM